MSETGHFSDMTSNKSIWLATLGVALLCAGPAVAQQQFQVSVYGGYQGASHSGVTTTDGDSFTAGWEGKPFQFPTYYGARGTWWLDDVGLPNTGLSIDFAHVKVYADDETLAESGYSVLEFTDGLNVLTVNALYKFWPESAFRPYVGAGVGITIPHVEVTRGPDETFEYQYGGPAIQAQFGVEYRFNESWSAFAEYKGNYSMVDVAIDNGERLKTNLVTHAVNVGVSYHF